MRPVSSTLIGDASNGTRESMSVRGVSVVDMLVAALMLFFTLAFFHARGASDVDRFWLNWINIMSQHESFAAGFKAVWADYPPISILWLDGIGRFSRYAGIDTFLVLKASVLVFLLGTTAVLYGITRNKSFTLLMHVMLMPSSILLTYLDIWYAPFLVLCGWYLYREKPGLALFYFALCCSIKYQPAILAPFVALYIWKLYQVQGKPPLAAAKAIGLTLLLYLSLMFWMVGGELLVSWLNALFHNRLSFQGLNAYWAYMQINVMMGVDIRAVRNASDTLLLGSRLLFLLAYGWLLFRFACEKFSFVSFLLYAMTGYYAYFVATSGVHENHLFVAAILAGLLFVSEKHYQNIAVFVLLMNNVNLILFNGLTGEGLAHSLVLGVDMTIPVAIVNTLFFVYLLGALSVTSAQRERWLGVTR